MSEVVLDKNASFTENLLSNTISLIKVFKLIMFTALLISAVATATFDIRNNEGDNLFSGICGIFK